MSNPLKHPNRIFPKKMELSDRKDLNMKLFVVFPDTIHPKPTPTLQTQCRVGAI